MKIRIPLWKKGKSPGEVEVEVVAFDFDDDYTDVMGTETKSLQFPHCDALVLHRPGTCEYCDRHPDWQQMRSRQGIAFSNDSDEHVRWHNLIPCPSTVRRPAEARDRWPGNVPSRSTS
jgi:hypothetical protein